MRELPDPFQLWVEDDALPVAMIQYGSPEDLLNGAVSAERLSLGWRATSYQSQPDEHGNTQSRYNLEVWNLIQSDTGPDFPTEVDA